MSSKINAREVLSYLNQLGYTNVNALQLQAFIKDLKKLMKFEELKVGQPSAGENKLVKVSIRGQSIARKMGESEKTWTDALFLKKNEQNVFHSESQPKLIERKIITEYNSSLERPITVPTPSKQKRTGIPVSNFLQSSSNSAIVCPVHYYRGFDSSEAPKSKTVKIDCNCPIEASSNFSSSHVSDTKKGKRPASSTLESKNKMTGTGSYLESCNDYPKHSLNKKKLRKSTGTCTSNRDFTHPCYCPESEKPRSAVIKCTTECVPPFQKCDPVNLHKYYQRQWKINKIPGENMSRDKRFRWCFRERISCGPTAKR